MAQEQFAGPEYFAEFDPEKFIRELKERAGGEAVEPEECDGEHDN